MNSHERIKRPKLDRTQPIRSWSTLFSAPPGSDATPAGAGAAHGPAERSWSDVVSRSVDLGYRVIDEYMRQGQKAAQRFTERSYTPDSMTSDAQEMGTRMAQYASDFTAVWLEFLQLGASSFGRWPTPPFEFAAPAGNAAPSAPPPPPSTSTDPANTDTRVRVAVTSPYPTEVSLDVRPQAVGRRLIVQSLRAVTEDKPRLSDVAIEDRGADEPLTLRIRVPAGQPAGVYNGLVVEEESGKPMGTVSLRILPE